jgi:ABC-type transport system substrate-binding protein
MRTGKLDFLPDNNIDAAKTMKQSKPEITQTAIFGDPLCVTPRNDLTPFSDINVRKALQMSLNLQDMANNYYGGAVDPSPSTLTGNAMTGWGYPYKEWPQALKDEYAYNPTQAKKLLSDAGYPTGFKTTIWADKAMDIDFLQIIKSEFADVGVDMTIQTMDTASFSAITRTTHKAEGLMYQGGAVGVRFEPLRQLTRFQKGVPVNIGMVNDATFETFYPKALAATSMDVVKQTFKDANQYVAQMHFSVVTVPTLTYTFSQPWIKGYTGQDEAIPNSTGTTGWSGFYAARFWIDQSVKKSMGY